jgi:regulator of sirC expression with transglutaminase-like and TPR domain
MPRRAIIPEDAPFRWLAQASEEDIPLFEAGLWIARDEYPDLDIEAELAALAKLATRARRLVRRAGDADLDRLRAFNRLFFEELQFNGNHLDFNDPRNSYLNDVLKRKLGIPISLSMVYLDIAQEAGFQMHGISFPGHFLVKYPVDEGVIVLDAFYRGRTLGLDELKARASSALGDVDLSDDDLPSLLSTASKKQILARMLRNLKGIYTQDKAFDKALRVTDRLVTLEPFNLDELRDRGQFYRELGAHAQAAQDFKTYLRQRRPGDDDEPLHQALKDSLTQSQRLH